MSDPYNEILEGEQFLRQPLGARHEQICAFLHQRIADSLKNVPTTRLLAPRSTVQVSPRTTVRPDLTLVTAETGKVWLVAEIINSGDHHADTVLKKEIYENWNVPRLWMIDPRYDNVEIYHGTPHGLSLKKILANREKLTEALLPELQIEVTELFRS
ncbi:MAG: uncharacterized protein JWM68_3190 [Verrucomicrobiales bacterium]|nr:uncharacterized protein [Verrucomicrobiales bacterium]